MPNVLPKKNDRQFNGVPHVLSIARYFTLKGQTKAVGQHGACAAYKCIKWGKKSASTSKDQI